MSTLYSVVVPMLNEQDAIPELYAQLKIELERLTDGTGEAFEIIFVDDGSADGSAAILQELAATDARMVFVQLRRNYGQTAAMMAGIQQARGDVIIPMDADGRASFATGPGSGLTPGMSGDLSVV